MHHQLKKWQKQRDKNIDNTKFSRKNLEVSEKCRIFADDKNPINNLKFLKLMKPEDVKKEQELNEEELDNVSGGRAPLDNLLEPSPSLISEDLTIIRQK